MIGCRHACCPAALRRCRSSVTSRSTRGRRRKSRQAMIFSTALISSSAPAAQKANEAWRHLRPAPDPSSASKSTLSTALPPGRFLPNRRWRNRAATATAAGICMADADISEWHCPGARNRGRFAVHAQGSHHGKALDRRQTEDLPRPASRAAVSSFPIRGTSAPRATCKVSASRRWPPPARATPTRRVSPTATQSCDQVLAHFAEIAAAADVPVNADFENGFADDLGRMAENVTRCIATGVAGLSIEDFTGDDANPLYDFDARGRARQGRARGHRQGRRRRGVHRPHRGFPHGRPDLDETIRRLKAFADAGADCLYSPGIKTREQIEADVKAVAPKPINFLNSGAFGFTRQRPRRRWACAASASAARWRASPCTPSSSRRREIAKDGKFDSFAGVVPNAELNKFFARRSHEKHRMTGSNPIRKPASRSGCRSIPRPPKLPGPVTLQGRYGRLEKLNAGHARGIYGRVSRTTTTSGPTCRRVRAVLRPRGIFRIDRQALRSGNDPYPYAILDTAGRVARLLHADAHRAGDARDRGRSRASIRPTLQRTPLGHRAQYLLARYVFETLGYRRYEWKCNALHDGSRRAALRLGFTYEGVHRQLVIAKGRNRDNAWFSMLDSEWPARKAQLRALAGAGQFHAPTASRCSQPERAERR